MISSLIASLALSPAWVPARTISDGWGVNLGFNDLAPRERLLLSESGFRWVRRDLFWHVVEPKKGQWDWSVYDRLLADLEPLKIRPVFILCYGNGLYQPDAPRTAEARAAFCRYVQMAVTRYKGKGIIWELWNEPNNHHWQPGPNVKEYVQLALEASQAFKKAAPKETLVGPALAGFDWPFAESCFKAGLLNYWDGVTVHPYRPMEPESSVPDYARLRSLIQRHAPKGRTIPILCGEVGYSHISVPGREAQADFFLRQHLVNLAAGVPLTIWYNWSDNGSDPKNTEHHYGIVGVAPEFAVKPAFSSARTMTRLLSGFTYSKRLAYGKPEDWLLLFTKGIESAVVAWTTAAEPSPYPADLPIPASSWNRSGSPLSLARPPLTNSPIVLRFGSGQMKAAGEVPELPLSLTSGSPDDLLSQLKPFFRRKVTFSSQGMTQTFVFGPDSVKQLARLPRFAERSRRPHDLLVACNGVPQRAALLHAAPIEVTVASAGRTASVTITPEGQGFSGVVELETMGKATRSPLTVARGQSKALKVEKPLQLFSVRLIEGGRSVRSGGPWQISPLPMKGARASLDGDAKVEGETKATESTAKEGPAVGGDSLLLDYSFGKGWKYALISPPQPLPVPEGADRLTFWVKGSGTGVLLLMRYQDSTGQTFQPEGVPVDWVGWKPVTFALDGSTGGRWGGANDGRVRLPIKITSLAVLDNPQGRGMKGQIELASPAFLRTLSRAKP